MSAQAPIYLDHNATTPVDPRVMDCMLPYFTEVFGNPASVEHVHGNRAQAAVKHAREQVAQSIGARENEIVFTSSCTEANNIAILGAARANPDKRHLITTAIEHPSVLEPFLQLKREGWDITILGTDQHGMVAPSDVASALQPSTLLVSVMGANNEVGTIQPIEEIGEICARAGVLFHSDLAQLLSCRKINVAEANIHLASISGHKLYGPKGVGALYVRSRSPRAKVAPIQFGGGQEKGLRPATVNVPLVVGLGEALQLAARQSAADSARLAAMSGAFREYIATHLEGVSFNGHPTERLPGNCSISIAGVEPLALMHRLNPFASFSASSACSTEKVETSPVLLAMFGDSARARQAFRVSPGRFTDKQALMGFAEQLVVEVAQLRQFAS